MSDNRTLIHLDEYLAYEDAALRALRVQTVRARIAAGAYDLPADVLAESIVPWILDDTPVLIAG